MLGSSTPRSTGWNAYLRRVEGEFVTITHPCHPARGRSVPVLHYRFGAQSPTVVVEMPDGSARSLPLSFTDHGCPDPHALAAAEGARLSGLALIDVVSLLDRSREGG